MGYGYGYAFAQDNLCTMAEDYVTVDARQRMRRPRRWDLHENLGSKGAVLFRRFWDRALTAQPSPWSHQFDPSDPVHTPYGLDTGNPQVRDALGDAIKDLRDAGIPLDASPA
jgi:acyl-homoserine-lactone acylase